MRNYLIIVALLAIAALAFLAGLKYAAVSGQGGEVRSMALMFIALGGCLLGYLKYAEIEDQNIELIKASGDRSSPLLLTELGAVKDELLRLGNRTAEPAADSATPPASGDFNGAVAALAKDLGLREKETQRLHEVLIRRDHRNVLARLATIRETAEFTRKINAAGKIADKEALSQVIMEIEAALDDLGLEIMHVSAGTRIADLPNGSFSILSATQAEAGEQPGTVKEAVTEAVFLRDADGKQVFIAPAKLRAYKL
jgi:hypothetical protein